MRPISTRENSWCTSSANRGSVLSLFVFKKQTGGAHGDWPWAEGSKGARGSGPEGNQGESPEGRRRGVRFQMFFQKPAVQIDDFQLIH